VLAKKPLDQGSLARVVFALDERLRRRYGVFDYVPHADCIFRAKVDVVTEPIALPDGAGLSPGDRIIELHFRNEYFPRMDEKGATMGWAIRATKLLDVSFRELAAFLANCSEFDNIAAVRAVMPLRGMDQIGQFERIATRFGFTLAPDPPPRGFDRVRVLGQNALALLLVLAGNPRAASGDILWRRGVSAFLSRRALDARYRGHPIQVPSGNNL
jgi:hypothetical protein